MVANNVDPNKMHHYGAMVFHQGLHCLTEKQTECTHLAPLPISSFLIRLSGLLSIISKAAKI